ncbi:MAG TPA: GNAT family N-acetyltransferase [Bacteroidales bacterium]|nr:GNAT family N-acetyltransferase [Bacteroidales bacterium]
MLLRFEEISNNAWPALQTLQYDGWILRFANGVTKRSNSVTLLYPSHVDPIEKIRFCESLYQSKNIVPCFKITPFSLPSDLDHLLENAGYYIHSHISFQTLDMGSIPVAFHREVMIETTLREEWIDDFIRMNQFDPARKEIYRMIMERLVTPFCMVSVKQGAKTLGVGLGVAEKPYIGLFDLVVDPEYRNRGIGRKLVEQILHWGLQQGATTAYLQVLTDNHPALKLYQSMGFLELYQYWYRMKPI